MLKKPCLYFIKNSTIHRVQMEKQKTISTFTLLTCISVKKFTKNWSTPTRVGSTGEFFLKMKPFEGKEQFEKCLVKQAKKALHKFFEHSKLLQIVSSADFLSMLAHPSLLNEKLCS